MILKDRVAVVTGAARGIGREIALLMAQLGARVVVNDYGGSEAGQGTTQAPANEVVEEIRKAGGQAVANYDSVATMAGGEHIVQTAIDAFGRVDIVVNNAGILRDRMIFNMTEEEWDAVLNTHLKGTFAVTRAAAPRMKEQPARRLLDARTPVRDVRRNAAAPPRPARHVWSVFQLRPSRLAHSAVRFSDGGGDSLAAQIFVSLTIELSTKNFVKSSSPSSKFV